jgi:hypothetical protein
MGDDILDTIAKLPPVDVPLSDEKLIPSFSGSTEEGYATVFVINFTKVDPGIDLTKTQIGTEFLVSLKNFLSADAVVSKEVSPGYYEVYVYKDGQYIESALNIKEMFGYQFFTHHPIGLLVAQDMGLLKYTKIIYDSYHNLGGVFVPMTYLGDVVEMELLNIQLYNRTRTVDAFTLSSNRIEQQILKHQLKVISKIGNYIFVEKSALITQRIIYKTIYEKNPEMLIVGEWDLVRMNPKVVIDIANELLREHNIVKKPNVREGPFSSLVVPVMPRLVLERFIEILNMNLKQKYNFGRQF